MGRPTTYKPEYCEQARKLCLLGATDDDLADFFDTTDTTIDNWKKKYPKFLASLKGAKDEADAKVVKSLHQRATGYDYGDKHWPPDVTACIFWLKNRDKENWRDKQEHELSGPNGKPIPVSIVDFGKIDDDTQ